MTKLKKNGIWAILCLLGLVPFVFWSAFVANKIYLWLAPQQWPEIKLSTFILFTCLLALYRSQKYYENKKENEIKFKKLFFGAIFSPAIILFVAYVSKLILF